MEKKKLLLIYPKNFVTDYSDTRTIKVLGKKGVFVSAALATVAALTPPEYEVRIVDENVEQIDFDQAYDLVGLTGFHLHLARAREIAMEFKQRGVPVVCGGPSVTLSTERWRQFADVLIVGEAEYVWPQFARDFLTGIYEKEYRETERFDLDISPVPDYSGFSRKSLKEFIIGIVQTSRGCPYDCDFCSVHVYVGHKMRYKSIYRIIEEVAQLHRMGIRHIFLADDNFSAGRKKASEILVALRNWNRKQRDPINFITQLSIDTAKDNDFLRLAAEAGLLKVYIGIESPNVASLKETKKHHNVRSNMIEDLKKINQFGIQIIGSTIVGFDNDDLSIFKMQFDFFMKTGIPKVHVYPLQARDGTRLKEKMISENRYLDWERKNGTDEIYRNLESFTIVPKQMNIKQLQQGAYWLVWNLYQLEHVTQRMNNFFETFSASPYRKDLHIPGVALSWEKFKILMRVVKFLSTEASSSERKRFRKLVRLGLKSSYPRWHEMVIGQFFIAKNIQDMLRAQYDAEGQFEYPSPEMSLVGSEQGIDSVKILN